MKIYENAIDLVPHEPDSVVTVGTFDGLHLGHRKLIERVVKSGSPSTLVTFYPHPQMVVARPGKEFKLLTPPAEKVMELSSFGLDRLVVLRFDRELMNLPAEKFLEDILVAKIGLGKMVIGHDHAFGCGRKGCKDFLVERSRELGFKVEVVPPFKLNDTVVSSTQVRRAIEDGSVDVAAQLLGRRYNISGWVIKGDARGTILGFPTANMKVNSTMKLLPRNGVYAVKVKFSNEEHPGLLYIGDRPTYGKGDLTIEVYILDWSGEIYGEEIKVEFLERLRGDVKFSSEWELVQAMTLDERNARSLFHEVGLN